MMRQMFGFLVVLFLGVVPQITSGAPTLQTELVSDGFVRPVFVTHSGDGSGRLFLLEQAGRVLIVKQGQSLTTPFLDISAKVDSGGERGLLGLAFHPEFEANGRFFVNYTAVEAGQRKTVVAEYEVSEGNPDLADTGEKRILEFDQPFPNHNAGMMAFGPDGFFYVATGDGGSGGDPQNNAQNLGSILGKILRIDVDRGQPYAIPDSNPFAGVQGTRPEIFAYGFRNPWRFSFDSGTGRLFAGDVGQGSWEEIDIVVRGGNYGWRIMEGNHCFNPPSNCQTQGLKLPISEYSHEEGVSVTGGYVYRGSQTTQLWGQYLFADFSTGKIWALREIPGGAWVRSLIADTGLRISSFGEDESGELYVLDLPGGSLHRLDFGSRLLFAQVGDGVSPVGVFQSRVMVVNESGEFLRGKLRLFDSAGDLRSERDYQVLPGRSLSLPTSGVANPVFAGWAEATGDQAFSAAVVFTLSDVQGEPLREAGVASSEPGRLFRAHVERSVLDGTDTGFAVANPSSQPVEVTLTVTIPVGFSWQATFELGPGQHIARFVGEVAGVPESFGATAELSASEDVIVTLMRTQDGIHSASLPVARLR